MGTLLVEVRISYTESCLELRKILLSYFMNSRLVHPDKNGGRQTDISTKCIQTLARRYELSKEDVDSDDQEKFI